MTPDSVSLPRSVNYIVDYICEPICARWMPCYRSARQRYSADKRPLTVKGVEAVLNYMLEAEDVKGVKSVLPHAGGEGVRDTG